MARRTLSNPFQEVTGFWAMHLDGETVEGRLQCIGLDDRGWYVLIKVTAGEATIIDRSGAHMAVPGELIGIKGCHALQGLRGLPNDARVWIRSLGFQELPYDGYLGFKVETDVK